MKREADGEMGSPQKRSRRGDDEVRLLIPSKVAGSIIGKGGQNITKLRSQDVDALLGPRHHLQHRQ
jgi:heterogeneous nuclear ribonucleoprotein K